MLDDMVSVLEEKWQISRDILLERNKYMFNNFFMSDIKFVFFNEQIILVYKYVFVISSLVFFVMFYGGLVEQGDIVDIIDCDLNIFF